MIGHGKLARPSRVLYHHADHLHGYSQQTVNFLCPSSEVSNLAVLGDYLIPHPSPSDLEMLATCGSIETHEASAPTPVHKILRCDRIVPRHAFSWTPFGRPTPPTTGRQCVCRHAHAMPRRRGTASHFYTWLRRLQNRALLQECRAAKTGGTTQRLALVTKARAHAVTRKTRLHVHVLSSIQRSI